MQIRGRITLVLALGLAMGCGGGSAGSPDADAGDVSGVSDLGTTTDESPADRPGSDALPDDVPPPDDVPLLPDDASPPSDGIGSDSSGPETAEETSDEGAPPVGATCEAPLSVWDGRTLGPDLPGTDELNYEVVTGPVTGAGISCAVDGSQGEAAFRLVLGKSLLVGIAAEAVGGDVEVAVAFRREDCAGTEADCFTSPAGGNIAEDGAVLTPGTWVAVVRTIPTAAGTDPLGRTLEVSFWFEDSEDCTDGIDNNEDGDTDCEDPLCFLDDHCTGGHQGEDCTDPFLVENGQPVAPGTTFNAHQTLAGRRDDFQPGPGCWADDHQGGDVVWRFVLDREMTVEASMGFFDGTFGHVYLLDQTCGNVEACIPPVFGEEPFVLATLPAGTWHAVADFGEAGPVDPSFEIFLIFDEP